MSEKALPSFFPQTFCADRYHISYSCNTNSISANSANPYIRVILMIENTEYWILNTGVLHCAHLRSYQGFFGTPSWGQDYVQEVVCKNFYSQNYLIVNQSHQSEPCLPSNPCSLSALVSNTPLLWALVSFWLKQSNCLCKGCWERKCIPLSIQAHNFLLFAFTSRWKFWFLYTFPSSLAYVRLVKKLRILHSWSRFPNLQCFLSHNDKQSVWTDLLWNNTESSLS